MSVYALEITTVGKRNARKAFVEIIPPSIDATVYLADYLEKRWTEGALIVASKGNSGTYGVCPRPIMPWHDSVLRVRLIEIKAVEAKAS